MKTTVRHNPSLAFTKALQELEETRLSIERKKFTPEMDELILRYWNEVPTNDLLQTINNAFDKDISETTLRRRYNTILLPDKNSEEGE